MPKKIMNLPEDCVSEAMEGFLAANKDYVQVEGASAIRVRNLKDKPAMIVGGGSGHEPMFGYFVGENLADASVAGNLPSLSSADADAVRQAVQYLYDLGHRHIARVGGPEALAHSYIRDAAFSDVAAELGIRYRCLHTDYTPESGREATNRLLGFGERPTAIIYDNDVMALAGLGVANVKGIAVPDELSLMSWDDSFMCTAAYPNLTAMGRNVVDTGKTAARLMLRLIDGEKVGHIMEEPYELRARESTGPAPAGR